MQGVDDFVIKKNDVLAPVVIMYWAYQAVIAGVNRQKIAKALRHLAAINEWQRDNKHSVKLPD